MKAASLLRLAARDGLWLVLESDDKIKAYGPPEAIKKWAPVIRSRKGDLIAEIGAELKTAKAAKISGWEKLADLPSPDAKTVNTAKAANDDSAASGGARPPLDWWNQPVAGWPRSLTIRNIMSGEATTIDLRSGAMSKTKH